MHIIAGSRSSASPLLFLILIGISGRSAILFHSNITEDMDTSNPAVFVNAELLARHVGQKVRTVIQILQVENGATTGRSADGRELIVTGPPSEFPSKSYAEVIGIAESTRSIRAEIWTNFGETFDTISYNQLCQLASGECKSLFL